MFKARVVGSLQSLQSLRNNDIVRGKMKELQSNLQKVKASLQSIRARINKPQSTPVPDPQNPQNPQNPA